MGLPHPAARGQCRQGLGICQGPVFPRTT